MTTMIKNVKQILSDSEELLLKALAVLSSRQSNILTIKESVSQMNDIYENSKRVWKEAHDLKTQLSCNKQKRLHEILSDSMRNTAMVSSYQKTLCNYNAQCIVDEILNKYGSIEEAVKQGFKVQ